ncbi:class I SAM-dependent methyltransferase [Roseofilum capinflatum]|uniref:Class I SAM-dependent methyltransferase n=1 Tax=Roseofilum capinflatum BLCC-M114 TaxID=3022440 RepID=A0ABT7B9X3_9CYAN|nr:class I SAM-dependent methyltransferase [Roseofilum capinflatum]MDJ1175399.1 class I SAM-dependent methyltransferase [Roseofilum capinflatum BLCC-M114]
MSFSKNVRKVVKNVGDAYFWPASKREFYELISRYPSASTNDIMHIINSYKGQGWYKRLCVFQDEQELTNLIDWARDRQPKIVMEIGTAQGGTLLAWCRIAQEMVISVDLEDGIHGGGYFPQKQRLYKELVAGREGVQVELIQDDSQKDETRQKVESILSGRRIDILFIDGDHRIEGVTRDFELWRSLVKPGGHILFHDILPHKTVKSCQVDVLWNQLRQQYPSQEIVTDYNQGWGGIGILTLPE